MSRWSDQRGFFDGTDSYRLPRETFTADHCTKATAWLVMGDQIVLVLDAREDVRAGTVTSQFHALGQ
jgi:hypothetical protein